MKGPKEKAEPRPIVRIRNAVLQECNVLHSNSQRESRAPVVEIAFSRRDASSKSNGFFINIGVRGMLEGKSFEAVDMIFRFVAARVD